MTERIDPNTLRALRRGALALCGVAALMLAGCAPAVSDEASGGDSSAEQPAEQKSEADEAPTEEKPTDDALTIEQIIAAVEPEGLTCTEEEPDTDARSAKVVCEGDDYVYITATRFAETGNMDAHIDTAKGALCESEFVDADAVRYAAEDPWILVPGYGEEPAYVAFDAAMKTLGLDSVIDPC